MNDIFISYSSEDRDRVLPLVNALEKTGWSVFWDRKILQGVKWRNVIESEMQNSRSMIVVWTKKSITSEWALEEAQVGKRKGILIPVLLDNVEPPFGFGVIQSANLAVWNGDSSSPNFIQLVEDIACILGPAPKSVKEAEQRHRLGAEAQHKAGQGRHREKERQPSEEEVKRKAEEETRKRIEEERSRAGKFFFSYGRADAEFVLKLAADLRSNGTNVWLDQLDIPGGARWDRAVEEALHASPCLLVVLSPASVASNNVMDEVSFGLETDKRIVPILFKDCAVPFRLKRFQYIDFRAGYDEGFKRLIQTLKPVNQLSTGQREKSDRRNFHFSWKLSVRGFSAFLSVTLVSILAIYLVMSQSPTEQPVVSNTQDSTQEVGRQMAYNLIQTASEKASMICREVETVKLKREGLKLEGQVESSMIDLLKKQIQDLDKNIAEATAAYADLITQLVNLRSDVVDSEFEHYTQWLTNKSSFVQISKTRMVKLHYNQYREGKRSVNVSMMKKDCEETLGKGT